MGPLASLYLFESFGYLYTNLFFAFLYALTALVTAGYVSDILNIQRQDIYTFFKQQAQLQLQGH